MPILRNRKEYCCWHWSFADHFLYVAAQGKELRLLRVYKLEGDTLLGKRCRFRV